MGGGGVTSGFHAVRLQLYKDGNGRVIVRCRWAGAACWGRGGSK